MLNKLYHSNENTKLIGSHDLECKPYVRASGIHVARRDGDCSDFDFQGSDWGGLGAAAAAFVLNGQVGVVRVSWVSERSEYMQAVMHVCDCACTNRCYERSWISVSQFGSVKS